MKQFSDVNCRYGAPMGRHGSPANMPDADLDKRTVRLFRVNLDSGGYDDGGAYWGIGAPLYCATDDGDYREFTRADNRFHAMALLNLPHSTLKIGAAIPGCYYESQREWCGQPKPRHILRYYGEFLSHHETKDELIDAMVAHYLDKKGSAHA